MHVMPKSSFCETSVEYVFNPITKQGKSFSVFKNGSKSQYSTRPELLD
jgi:hypothetical protein